MGKTTNWTTITESRYSWERDALDFVRERFPSHEPYRAWSNFEFIGDDGSINEVDLLVFTPHGFFLIEIKSRPGRLFGDAGTWTWDTEGKLATFDSPLLSANLKAKKLRSLLERQRAAQRKGKLPHIEALVYCSAPELQCELQGNARYFVRAGQPDPRLNRHYSTLPIKFLVHREKLPLRFRYVRLPAKTPCGFKVRTPTVAPAGAASLPAKRP